MRLEDDSRESAARYLCGLVVQEPIEHIAPSPYVECWRNHA
jgi:hypothetical protein